MIKNDVYVQVTKKLFRKHLASERGDNAFIAQRNMERMFRRTVETCVKNKGELFASDIEIVTEKLSPVECAMVERTARRHGYDVVCKNSAEQLEYIGSDGGGHYSQDFYRYLEYGIIRVTAR